MDTHLRQILKGVSRSFYLSIILSPHKLRDTLGLAFLLCKAADTIADTELVPPSDRLEFLNAYRNLFTDRVYQRGQVLTIAGALSLELQKSMLRLPDPKVGACSALTLSGAFFSALKGGAWAPSNGSRLDPFYDGTAAERTLLSSLPLLISALHSLPTQDQQAIEWLVPELTQGMILDLTYWGQTPHLGPVPLALPNDAALDRYTYYVAGCVGRFWTRILKNHHRFAAQWGSDVEACGEKLGKGLQLVNILRDLPRDLVKGRCYLPQSTLAAYGLTPEMLRNSQNLGVARPCLEHYLEEARTQLRAGEEYLHALPRKALRLRAAVALPMRLGFETLDLLEAAPGWLDPKVTIKVSRASVYRNLLGTFLPF